MAVFLSSPGPQFDFGKGPHWLHESPFLPLLWEQTQELGAPSLKHAAMKRVLMDQSLLTPELFAQVPWHIAKYLWECLGQWCVKTNQTLSGGFGYWLIGSSNKQTLHTWMIMAKVYPQHFRQLSPSYSLHIDKPTEPLKLYIDMVSSDSCDWCGALSLSTSNATIADLVAIGNMTNLVALEIFTISSPYRCLGGISDASKGLGLDDRIVRSWVEAAESMGSLQQLRVLRIAHQRTLTTQALRMLETLPRLEVVVVYHCAAINEKLGQYPRWRDDEVRVEGWTARKMHQIVGDQDAETVALNRLLPLLDLGQHIWPQEEINRDTDLDQAQQTFKESGAERRQFNLGPDSLLMQFQLAPSPFIKDSKMRARAVYEGWDIVFFTRKPYRRKKRVLSESVHFGKGKRVMKDQGAREIGDVLGDFF